MSMLYVTGCNSRPVKKIVVQAATTYIVENNPEQIAFVVKQIVKIAVKEIEPSKEEIAKAVEFINECKTIANDPKQYSINKLKELAQKLPDNKTKLIAITFIDFAERYVNFIDKSPNARKIMIIVCDAALEVLNNEK
jgi:hypothetical protein